MCRHYVSSLGLDRNRARGAHPNEGKSFRVARVRIPRNEDVTWAWAKNHGLRAGAGSSHPKTERATAFRSCRRDNCSDKGMCKVLLLRGPMVPYFSNTSWTCSPGRLDGSHAECEWWMVGGKCAQSLKLPRNSATNSLVVVKARLSTLTLKRWSTFGAPWPAL